MKLLEGKLILEEVSKPSRDTIIGMLKDGSLDDSEHIKTLNDKEFNELVDYWVDHYNTEDDYSLDESRGKGFVEKYKGYSIIDVGDRYVITDKNGLNVGETKFGLPVVRGMIDVMVDNSSKEESLKESKELELPEEDKIEAGVLPDVIPDEPIVVSTEPIVDANPVLEENAMVTLINSLIKDEFEAIDGYTSAISTLTTENAEKYSSIINILNDISTEENVHIGQLQEVLKLVSPNAEAIEQGKIEAQDQIIDEEPTEEPVENDFSVDENLKKEAK